MFRLRVLVFTVVLAAALIHAAGAQQPVTGQRIGFLGSSVLLEIFRTAIADLGYQEGRDILIDRGWPEENRLDRLPEEAAALIKLKPKVIVTVGATATRAAKAATTEIPIVFAVVIDPASFRGGNVTGFSTFDPEQAKKQLSILQETIPGLARVALLGDAQAAPILFQENEDAARTLGLKTHVMNVERVPNPDFEAAIEEARRAGSGAIVVISTPVTTPNRKRIAQLAAKYGLPTLAPRDHADSGVLISYGTGFSAPIRHAAMHVDKILKGAEPGDLSVGAVHEHELIVNLKTAREIAVTIPPWILDKATQIIQ